jgi:alkyl hydroperoxide reductase subunit AhpC
VKYLAKKMPLELLSKLPNFGGKDQLGQAFDFYSFSGEKWCVVWSYPHDFTPVCSTEMAAFAAFQDEFERRNCKLVAVSTDSFESHARWLLDIASLSKAEVRFPVIADESNLIVRDLGFSVRVRDEISSTAKRLREKEVTSRCLYILDSNKTIQFVQVMPFNTGRDLNEIFRVLDSLQLSVLQEFVATPADWKVGNEVVILPNATEEDLTRIHGLSESLRSPFPYLRFAPLKPLVAEETEVL